MRAYQVIIQKEQDAEGFHAFVPTVPGCHSWGLTIEEAETNITEALEGFLEMLRSEGQPIPNPDLPMVETVTIHD